MQIKEIKIYNYGKLQNKEVSLEPGINLIYGENEAGKSTMQAFIKSMLFGMEKTKGRAAAGDLYTKYEPWHAPSYYSGAMRFEVEGRPFYLERNFYVKEKQERLCNEADGEELSIAYGDLSMLLGKMNRAGYENTYEVGQSGATTGAQMTEILTEYLSDAAGSGAGATHVTRALAGLASKKKEIASTLKQMDVEKKQKVEHFEIEKGILERDISEQRRLVEQTRQQQQENEKKIRRFQEQQREKERDYAAESKTHQFAEEQGKKKKKQEFGIFERFLALFDRFTPQTLRIGGAALAILNSFAYQIWYQIPTIFWILEMFFIFLFFLGIFRGSEEKGQEHYEESTLDEEKEALQESVETGKQIQRELERTFHQSGKMLQKLEDTLVEKEVRLSNLKEQLEQLEQPSLKERELLENIEALNLAITEIERLSKNLCEDIRDELDAQVSKYVSGITAGKYDRVRVDENGKLQVFHEGRTISPEQLSRGTLEQLYLSLRLAVGGILSQDESLPIMLDEAFAMYDEKRLEEAIRMISKLNVQVLLFTCQMREEETLQKMGISYQKVVL